MRRAGWCLARISGRTACSRARPDDQRGNRRRAEVDVAALVVAVATARNCLSSFPRGGGLGVGLLGDGPGDTSSPQVPANGAVAVRIRWILAVSPPRERRSPSA